MLMIAARALRDVETLPANERADLFEGVSLIVEGDEADQARLVAFSIREAERCQLTFLTQLNGKERA